MASFCELDWKRIIIDRWKKDDFSPTLDFLLPYAKHSNRNKSLRQTDKYHIDQLIISHPHKDHISDIENLYKHFYPEFVTTPNDNKWMENNEVLNRELFLWNLPIDKTVQFFKDNLVLWRTPPLKAIIKWFEIYYIPPKKIEQEITPILDYPNNTSLVCIIQIWKWKILLPWDIMPTWIQRMINNKVTTIEYWTKTEKSFENAIKKRDVEILIAPHHWLKSAFCTDLMNNIKDTLKLVIIPEKPTNKDSIREVDNRYYSTEFGSGTTIYNYESKLNEQVQWAIKTSMWHIIITENNIINIKENKNLMNAFNL